MILTPSIGYVHARAHHAISAAIAYGICFWKRTFGWDAITASLVVDRVPIDKGRNMLAAEAIQHEADWIWWIDDDVEIPPKALERLWAHTERGAQIVSAPISKKHFPPEVMAYVFQEGTSKIIRRPVWSGTHTVDAVGMGCVLMSGAVLGHVWKKRDGKPFNFAGGKYQTEELAFFEDCHEAGFPVTLDTEIEIKHFGIHGFATRMPVCGHGSHYDLTPSLQNPTSVNAREAPTILQASAIPSAKPVQV